MKSVFKEHGASEEMSGYVSRFIKILSFFFLFFFYLKRLSCFIKLKHSFIPKVLRPCSSKLFNYR